MQVNLSRHTVFLTGGSRGIGCNIKKLFTELGANVIAPTRSELDLEKRDSIYSYLNRNAELSPDIFIHCAGLNELAGIDEISDEILDRVFQVNLYSGIELASSFADGMADRGWGRIIFISSLYSIVSKEKRIAYSSSKCALNGLIRTMALELAPKNILVNGIAPGYVLTDMTRKNLSDEEIRNIEDAIPTGRFQSENEIASLAAFLCSEWNQSITGQVLVVDGGYTCR